MRRIAALLAVLLVVSISFASLPADAYKPGRMMIKFTPDFTVPQIDYDRGVALLGVPELDALAREFGVMKIEKVFPNEEKPDNPALVDLSRWYYFLFPEEVSVEDVIESYRGKAFINMVDYDMIRYVDYTPNDPMLLNQWYIFNIKADSAWDVSRGNSNVIIAIVDSGIDTTHEDLQANSWLNLGEDANGDSLINLWDWNNWDDDGNGFVDDFYGWDFVQNDNSPHDADTSPEAGHGTHCAGDASAVADNGAGVAGPGFSTTIMPIRCGIGGSIQYGLQGINYARVSGANVISMSYGSDSPWGPENDALQAAWQAGIVLVASAGNDNSTVWHYPSAYQNVIGVGASDQNDNKVYFSNYNGVGGGMYNVDVMSPGIDILSTQLGGGYVSWPGTSMSTPIVAGICGLIWNLRPDFTNADIVQTIFDTVDDIYPQNPGYSYPQLGYGRVNAFNAVLSVAPYIRLDSFELVDNGNGDGRADPGETIELTVYVNNDPRAQSAMNVTGVLSTDDEAVIMINDTESFGNIIPGFSTMNSTPFEFEIGPTDPHWAEFELTMTTQEGVELVIPLDIELGRPGVLLVDDDGGSSDELYIMNDFSDMEYFVDVWDQNAESIDLAELSHYEVVIWHCSDAEATLSSDDQTMLASYLDDTDHKSLIFSSCEAGDDIGTTSFYSDYLHADYLEDASGEVQMVGVSGTITEGDSLFFIGGSSSGNNTSLDVIEAVNGGEILYSYMNAGTGGAVAYEFTNNSKVVYTAFPIDAVNPTFLNYTNRVEILITLFDWFGWTEVEPLANKPLPTEFSLEKNYPNPFNPQTMINFSVLHNANVSLKVFNAAGQEVATLVDGDLQAGRYHALFKAENLASGIYVAVMQADGRYFSQKMVLVK